MADFTRQSWTRPRTAVPRPIDEEIHPSSGWTNDFPGFHCLLVNLPGFNEDDIKLNVDKSGIIVVSGRRKVDDEKHEHFEKTFNVPEDGDVNNIIKIFDGATLKVRIPKVPKTEIKKPSSADAASTTYEVGYEAEYQSGYRVFTSSDWRGIENPNQGKEMSPGQEEKSWKASVLLKIVANKGILLAFIISFTLVVLLSQNIHPSST